MREARILKGWTLDDLAATALGNKNSKGFLSKVEQGKRQVSPLTAGKLVTELGLDKALLKPFLSGPPEDEVTETDHLVEPLLKQAETDPAAAKLAESLLITLAYEFAGGHQGDVASAYANLRGALEAAQRLIAQGTMPSNLDAQVQATLAEVSRLVQDNRADEASALVDRELVRLADEVAERNQARSQLHQTAIDLARTRNDPKSAADHILAKLNLDTPPDLLNALRVEWHRWYETGRDQGGAFDLDLSIHLAEAIVDMAQTRDQRSEALNALATSLATLGSRETDPARLQAAVTAYENGLLERTRDRVPLDWAITQNNLGNVLADLGRREGDPARLQAAVDAYGLALLERTRDRAPQNWAMTQNNLGTALADLGRQKGDPARLQSAVDAYGLALLEYTRDRAPLNWAATQNNLGNALRELGRREGDPARLQAAVDAFGLALLEFARDRVPLNWAMTQNNLADLDLAFHGLSPNPALLVAAKEKALAAREVFMSAKASAYVENVDRILAKIDAM